MILLGGGTGAITDPARQSLTISNQLLDWHRLSDIGEASARVLSFIVACFAPAWKEEAWSRERPA